MVSALQSGCFPMCASGSGMRPSRRSLSKLGTGTRQRAAASAQFTPPTTALRRARRGEHRRRDLSVLGARTFCTGPPACGGINLAAGFGRGGPGLALRASRVPYLSRLSDSRAGRPKQPNKRHRLTPKRLRIEVRTQLRDERIGSACDGVDGKHPRGAGEQVRDLNSRVCL